MAVFDPIVVLEALRVADVVNNRMTLQHEVPQPSYKTKSGRTYSAADKTEEAITGYSIYSGSNAGGPYTRVVAHKDDSHVMQIIAVDDEGKPYITKFNAHEMCLVGKHANIEKAINAHPALRATHLF
jgi:hypothetical protein